MGGKNSVLKPKRNGGRTEETTEETTISTTPKGTQQPSTFQTLSGIPLKLKEYQMGRYKETHLRGIVWLKRTKYALEELFVEPLMFPITREGSDKNTSFTMKEMFKNNNDETPRRILLEGGLGCGKTTVALKLLSDWSKKESYVHDLFDLAFMISARNYDGDLYSCLRQRCNISETDQEIRKALEERENRVLLILDGLDEASEEAARHLLPLLKGIIHANMTVICTCRRVITDSKNESASGNTTASDNFGNYSFWDKRVSIKGFSDENRKEFIRRYLNKDVNRIENFLANSSLPILELCESPLFFLLLAAVLMEMEIESVGNWTALFKTVFNFFGKQNPEENLEKEHEDDDIFKSETQSALIFQNALVKFGKLALEKIKRKCLVIDKDEILKLSETGDSVERFGFIREQVPFLRFEEEEEHYKPIHKTFMEFSAAFYLSTLNEIELESEVASLADVQLLPRGSLFLYTFLGGLLQKDAHKLFKALLPWRCMITLFKEGFSRILLEIPQTEDIFQSLAPFTPRRWPDFSIPTSVGQWFSSIISRRRPERPLETIQLRLPADDISSLSSLPETLNANKIILDIKKIKPESNESWKVLKAKHFQCRNLNIISSPNMFENVNFLLEIMSVFEAEQLDLTLIYSKSASELGKETEKSEFATFYDEMIEGKMKNLNIHHLSILDIHPCNFHALFPSVKSLIEGKRIENGLSVTLFSYSKENLGNSLTCLGQFFDAVCASDLKNFLFDHSVNLPLATVPNLFINQKYWNYVCVSGNYSEEAVATIRPFFVEVFDCLGRYRSHEYAARTSKLLSECKDVHRLICSDGFIQNINDEFPSTWGGFESIERIDVFIVEDLNSLWFAHFKNIRHLVLSFYSFFLVDHEGDVLFELVSSLPLLKTIVVDNDCVDDVKPFILFLEKLSHADDEDQEMNVRLDSVEVSLPLSVEPLTSFCLSVEKCILKNILGEFSFRSSMDPKVITHHPVVDYFLPNSEFRISSDLYDSDDLYASLSEEGVAKSYEKISISLSKN